VLLALLSYPVRMLIYVCDRAVVEPSAEEIRAALASLDTSDEAATS
jgi:hypothetical protein